MQCCRPPDTRVFASLLRNPLAHPLQILSIPMCPPPPPNLPTHQPVFTDNGLDDRPTGADAAHSVDLALMFVDPDKGILLQEYQPIHQVGGVATHSESGVKEGRGCGRT